MEEILTPEKLICRDDWLRPIERAFRQDLLKHDIGDDSPLEPCFEVSAVFDAKPGRSYRLIGGNPDAGAPVYDLAKAVKGVADSNVPLVEAGALAVITAERDVTPWTERHNVIVWLVLVLAVAAMATLIVANIRKLRQAPPEDTAE